MFSINRVLGEALLPDGATYTFWGKGLSQGHSDAIRRVEGVAGGVQYTIPVEEAVNKVRSGVRPELSTREKHQRECHVVLKDGADAEAVRKTIVEMPHYFDQYDTTVHFISAEELARDHSSMPHGGFVIRSGNTSAENKQVIEYRLQLDSNPEFTSSVLVAYARAVHRLAQAANMAARPCLTWPPACCRPRAPNNCVPSCCKSAAAISKKPRRVCEAFLCRNGLQRQS
jgi:diaminopimelate dehydrogenase